MKSADDTRNQKSLTRRDWLAITAVSTVGACVPSLSAQEVSLETTLKSMEPLTGAVLSRDSLASASSLVSVIVESSKGLRSLDLGEIEPATEFQAK